MSEEFRAVLKDRARGPSHLGPLEPALCEKAMGLILAGEATPAQIGGFLLVGRAAGDTAEELAAYARAATRLARRIESPPGEPVVTVTGGFDGKLRTMNVGAVASLVAAASGARVLHLGHEGTPPKEGRATSETLRRLGISAPLGLAESCAALSEHGLAAASPRDYLPEMHALLGLRRDLVRRTALNVVEKLVSPVEGSRFLVGVSHRPYLALTAEALAALGVGDALVVQAVEGSDEAPLDGTSAMVRVRGGKVEEPFAVSPADLGLYRATRAQVPWQGEEDETARLLAALRGEEGPLLDLIFYNAALRLWVADWATPLAEHLENARAALASGAALALAGRMSGRRETVSAF